MGFQRKITVEGLNLERFIRRAGECSINLIGLERKGGRCISAVTDEAKLDELRDIADAGGWRMHSGERVGAGHMMERLCGRWLLLAILLAVCAGMLVVTRFVWRIEVYDAGAYEADIAQALAEMGIHAPMVRGDIDLLELRDALEWRYPQVAWIECGLRGMRLEIRVVEGVHGDTEITGNGPCDIVATRAGVVQRIETRAGTPVVKAGDVVSAGDTLIKGEERTSGGAVRQVAARGSVYARVWDSAAVQTSLRVVESDPTGRTQTARTVESPWFSLWRVEPAEYVHQDVTMREIPLGGFFWPLKIRDETRIETDLRSAMTDYRSVLDENNRAAVLKLYELAGGKESLVDNWVNWSIIEDEILLSVATGERLMDIGRQERSSGMAVTE